MDANRTPTALVRGVHHFTLSCGNGYQEALIGDYQANCVFQAVASPPRVRLKKKWSEKRKSSPRPAALWSGT
jgi:hypothetical protein